MQIKSLPRTFRASSRQFAASQTSSKPVAEETVATCDARAPGLDKLLAGPSQKTPPSKLVVFGATGDLVEKRLMRDSMVYLAEHDQLDPGANDILLVGPSPSDGPTYLAAFHKGDAESTTISQQGFDKFKTLTHLDAPGQKLPGVNVTRPEAFKSLRPSIGAHSALYYAALPPSLYAGFLTGLKTSGLADPGTNGDFRRVLLEKPFGTDSSSARALQDQIKRDFKPGQVLLVDHFLAYPGTLDLLALRTDPAVDKALSKEYVDKVDVKLLETIRSNDRPYFRQTGIVKDMIQSHALQLLATVAADLGPADKISAESYRHARTRLTESIVLNPASVQHGQFDGFNDPTQGAPAGAPASDAETFSRFDLKVNTPRWEGVPFTMTAAKGVDQTRFGVDVHLRKLPPALARRLGVDPQTKAVLSADINPARLQLRTEDGHTFDLKPDTRVKTDQPPDARLIRDAMAGQNGLFVEPQEAVKSWNVVEQVEHDAGPMLHYAPGTSPDRIGA